ncbi:MAG: flagellar hook assembly protein FlgD [Planctomycetota bacterium]
MRQDKRRNFLLLIFSFLLLNSACLAVTSKVTRHSSSVDFLKGEIEDIVVSSEGTIQLGRAAETIAKAFEDVWSINSIVVSGGTVFVGTSPNGGIYKYTLGKLTKIYPANSKESQNEKPVKEPDDTNAPADANTVETEQYLSNEHIFAMATDVTGRLLAGISGDKCRLMRFKAGSETLPETLFEPNDVKYIFAIAIGDDGDIYLGTGPEGGVYRLDSFGKNPQLIYDCRDKNILSLAIGQDGFIYAGSDSRGLVYKIDPRAETATVLYDSDQQEITALLFAERGDLYAAATSAEIVAAQTKFASQLPLEGRPETESQKGKSAGESKDGLKLNIPNTKKGTGKKTSEAKPPIRKPSKPGRDSYIYKITSGGFVTDVFSERAVFFCLAEQDKMLLVGTGNNAQLFTIDPAAEESKIVYEDQQASQITATVVAGEDIYLGTANPAKLIKLAGTFAVEGTYTSDLIDASQPAKWGKLQIEADIPEGCRVRAASRSGNVKDVNDPTFSDWTELRTVTGPIQLRCPAGRFCQYKLVLLSEDGGETPIIREIAVADTIPNLAPKLESVSVGRFESAGKEGMFKITYKAGDDNGDELIYRIDFRKIPRTNWIQLEDDIEKDSFDWDGKTVEDGRYEVRVTASDERGNTTASKLTASRISEPVIVDNTAPVIEEHYIESPDDESVRIIFKAVDRLSAIGKADYTVDSNADWIVAVPDDLVYDTTEENFTVTIDELEKGDHIVSLRLSDAVGNTAYKTLEVSLK